MMAFAADQAYVHEGLNQEARELRRRIAMRTEPGDLTRYIRCWSEEDVLDDHPCQALVVILKTRGCTWALAGGCTMCGYANDSAWSKVGEDDLVKQFERAFAKYGGEELVKIYTSGSFTDPKEVPPGAQRRILEHVAARGTGVAKVAFESLPVFLTDESLAPLAGIVPRLEVGIGVESASDLVLRDSINKGHGFASLTAAAAACRKHGVSVKSYLMCKPPFLKESDALHDSTRTIGLSAPHSDVMSLNPTNVQGNTVVDALYRRGSYRTPWLWTLVHALRDGLAAAPGYAGILKSDVVAAGQDRGAHNCGRCDEEVGGYLKKFKATQDPSWLDRCLERVQCPCRREWELRIALGPLLPAYGDL